MGTFGRVGGLVVSGLAINSDDPSSIAAEVYNFSDKNKNKQKEAGVGPFKKRIGNIAGRITKTASTNSN